MARDFSKAVTADTYASVLAANSAPEFAFRATDVSALVHWQRALRARLVQQLGIPHIAVRCSAGPVVIQRGDTHLDDHVREEWDLTPEPGFRVPFFLLRPLNQTGPRPLVLTPHGHSARGRHLYAGIASSDTERVLMIDGERDIALQAVREGYIAIAPEARAFDESRGQQQARHNAVSSCTDWQMRALMFNRTLIGERVWDIMRLIDYAATRDDVDTRRIAITGNSGGGTTSLFAAAIDKRISVAVPSCYFCTFLDSIGAMPHCACNYFPGMAGLAEMRTSPALSPPARSSPWRGGRTRSFPSRQPARRLGT